MKRFIFVIMALAFMVGCTSLKTPEIKGVVVDAETGKPIEGARIYAKWQKTVSGPGGQTGGAVAKELRLITNEDGSFVIPAYSFINYMPYPIGQGGSFYFVVYAHGYMYRSYSFDRRSALTNPKYSEFLYQADSIKAQVPVTGAKDEKDFDSNMMLIKDIQDYRFAIDEYRIFPKLFPNSKQIPATYIYIAFIYWNNLNDYEAALNEYELLLEKYPAYVISDQAAKEIAWLRGIVKDSKRSGNS